jgi:hypothetical protein
MPELQIIQEPKMCYLCARGSLTIMDKIVICVQCIEKHLDYQVDANGGVTKIFRERLQSLKNDN